jgi:hypothetical protein
LYIWATALPGKAMASAASPAANRFLHNIDRSSLI